MGFFGEKIKTEREKLSREMRSRLGGYLLAAFGLVAGLAWNEAVQSLIREFFPLSQDSIAAKFVYAGVLTVVVVLVSAYLARFLERE